MEGELDQMLSEFNSIKLGLVIATLRVGAEIEIKSCERGERGEAKRACKECGISRPGGQLAVELLGAWLKAGGKLEHTGIPLAQAALLKNDPPEMDSENLEDVKPMQRSLDSILRKWSVQLHSQAYRLTSERPALAAEVMLLAGKYEWELRRLRKSAEPQAANSLGRSCCILPSSAPARIMREWAAVRSLIIPSRAQAVRLYEVCCQRDPNLAA